MKGLLHPAMLIACVPIGGLIFLAVRVALTHRAVWEPVVAILLLAASTAFVFGFVYNRICLSGGND